MGRHYRADDPALGQPDPLRDARQASGAAGTGNSPDDWFRDTTTPPAAYRSTPGYSPAPDDVLSTSPAMHPVARDRTHDENAAELTTRLDPVAPAGASGSGHAADAAAPTGPEAPRPRPGAGRRPEPRPHPERRRFHAAGGPPAENPRDGNAHERGDVHERSAGARTESSAAANPPTSDASGVTDNGRDALTSTGGRRRVSSTGRHSAVSATGGHRAVTSTGGHGTVTGTGSHRAVSTTPKRKIAAWPVVCGVLVVLIVAGIFGWNWVDGVLSNRAEAQAAACQEGKSTLRVATAPAVAEPVRQAAKAWNNNDTVVHGHCVNVNVQPGTSEVVFKDLTGNRARGTPAAWIMSDTTWADRLASKQPDRIGASPEKVTSGPDGTFTYVSLAGDGVDTVQQRAAQSFLAHLTSSTQQKRFAQAGFTG